MRLYTWFAALLLLAVSASLFGRDAPTGAAAEDTISPAELAQLADEYLRSVLNAHPVGGDLAINNLFCAPVAPVAPGLFPDGDLALFTAEADFSGWPLNGRLYDGRLEALIAVRTVRPSVRVGPLEIPAPFGAIRHEVDKDRSGKVTLKVHDALNDHARAALVRTYVNRRYNRPLDIEIPEDKTDVFPDAAGRVAARRRMRRPAGAFQCCGCHPTSGPPHSAHWFWRLISPRASPFSPRPSPSACSFGTRSLPPFACVVWGDHTPGLVVREPGSCWGTGAAAAERGRGGSGASRVPPVPAADAPPRVIKMRAQCVYRVVALRIGLPPVLTTRYAVTIDVTYQYDESDTRQPWRYTRHDVVDWTCSETSVSEQLPLKTAKRGAFCGTCSATNRVAEQVYY